MSDKSRDSHFFLAGWNGCMHRRSASEAFAEAQASAPPEQPLPEPTAGFNTVNANERETVEQALEIVEGYGPWGTDINESLRLQIVLADEVKRLRELYVMAVKGRADFRNALKAERAAAQLTPETESERRARLLAIITQAPEPAPQRDSYYDVEQVALRCGAEVSNIAMFGKRILFAPDQLLDFVKNVAPAAEVAEPVAHVPRARCDSEFAVKGEFRWYDLEEKPFDVSFPEHWECVPLYLAPPTEVAQPVALNYFKVQEFADKHRLDYNELSAAARSFYATPQPSPVAEVAERVGDTRFEGWLSEHQITDVQGSKLPVYHKQDMRECYWAGYLEATPQPAATAGWQPIETAPKGGLLIDLLLPTSKRYQDCYYDRICDEYRTILAGHLIRLKGATHWMLPPPPPQPLTQEPKP